MLAGALDFRAGNGFSLSGDCTWIARRYRLSQDEASSELLSCSVLPVKSSKMIARAVSILDLDDYFLIRLLEHLKAAGSTILGAVRLSCTCRRLRGLSMSMLFSHCKQDISIWDASSSDSHTIPSTLWPHVRTIKLCCRCIDGYFAVSDWDNYTPQDSDVICGALESPKLQYVLQNMPYLSAIVVRPIHSHWFGHGLSWDTLCGFLSLPQLSRLVLEHVHICPRPPDAAALQLQPCTPISSFEYLLPNIRDPYGRLSETEALDRVLRFLHHSLETLSLPAEPAPIITISSLDWPRLRELRLRGLRWTTPTLPIVGLFARMPNLRVLSLELMEGEGVSATALWPRGFPASYPWPYLESLSVSHPDPEDEIYAHLPPTLRTLMLQSWPHQCIRRWQEVNYEPDRLRSYSPPISSSTLLRVLQRCDSPDLRMLGVEYCSDYTEVSLLSHIASNFPRLTALEFHRYRPNGDAEIPVLDIARPLASLSALRILKVHLDFPRMNSSMLDRNKREPRFWTERLPPAFERSLQSSAIEFAQVLGPRLQEVWHFVYQMFQLQWRRYEVIRVLGDGVTETRVTMQINRKYDTQWR
ncbi:hypothetical protein OH76DRAFT_1465503 [Lentinus brumalis]|uniref:F-box domain-containing protein n=1 Tax=Lentinus brumalis TaxID=2498619 RepID=A0A371D130_9APHY|nr:hypothetical protein OH76DRAFT_1465503 [Polyporus brumalis]